MAGLVPAIHALLADVRAKKDVDARDKRGHDDGSCARPVLADDLQEFAAVAL